LKMADAGNQRSWWVREKPSPAPAAPQYRGVAYYRHSARDRQENSVAIQQELVQKWAKENGVEIIYEFADRGKSGLTAEGRDAFNDMMDNWVKKREDFQFVLCLDVSRWGRFQDIDLSATYSADCKRHGKQVIYTTLGMPRPDDPLYPVYVQFERFRAAQFSKELSVKVFHGCIRIAKQGYWVGGRPPYGYERLLLDEARKPVQILAPYQKKGIQNQRVTLTPGPEEQVATVRRIFSEFIDAAQSSDDIAEKLNRDGLRSARRGPWNAGKVLRQEVAASLGSWLAHEAFPGSIESRVASRSPEPCAGQRVLSVPQSDSLQAPPTFPLPSAIVPQWAADLSPSSTSVAVCLRQ